MLNNRFQGIDIFIFSTMKKGEGHLVLSLSLYVSVCLFKILCAIWNYDFSQTRKITLADFVIELSTLVLNSCPEHISILVSLCS